MDHQSASFQIPDLPSFVRSFELKTNNHTKWASDASIRHLCNTLPSDFPVCSSSTTREKKIERLGGGLLASACYPTCDGPQLRLVTDFCTLWMMQLQRDQHGWDESAEPVGGIDLLNSHDLFKYLRPGIKRLVYDQSEDWERRFGEAFLRYRSAQMGLRAKLVSRNTTSLDECVTYLREGSGVRLLLELIEPSEGLSLVSESDDIRALRDIALDIMSWSLDIASYKIAQSRPSSDRRQNLLTVLMEEKDLSLQTAAYHAGDIVKDSVARFLLLEERTLSPPPSDSWFSWFGSKTSGRSEDEERRRQNEAIDLRLWIRGLKDCIVGTINWLYETDLFFGESGMSVREYGWVFLRSSVTES